MKLIVGLGNPGKEYENTRHNVGFIIIDSYLGSVNYKNKFNGLLFEKIINSEKLLFLKPQTYMNDSGISIKQIVDYYNIKLSDIYIFHDDMDFEIGTFKIKPDGSPAGHNGIKSIINNLKSDKFNRIRVGISHASYNAIDYVLGKFSKEEKAQLQVVINKSKDIINDISQLNIEKIMSKYN